MENTQTALTSEPVPEQPPMAQEVSDKPTRCHFLRLPTELRLQIYAYTNLTASTILVRNLPTVRTKQGTLYFMFPGGLEHRYPNRLETKNVHFIVNKPRVRPILDSTTSGPRSRSSRPKGSGCLSVHGLFSLTSVCRQTRADTHSLVYQNAFHFSDWQSGHRSALRTFTQSATSRQMSSVHTIYWPLTFGLLYHHSLRGFALEEADQACVEALTAMKGLKRVVLRYRRSDLSLMEDRFTEEEAMEQRGLQPIGARLYNYDIEREFRRTLATRGIEALMGRAEVKIDYEKLPG